MSENQRMILCALLVSHGIATNAYLPTGGLFGGIMVRLPGWKHDEHWDSNQALAMLHNRVTELRREARGLNEMLKRLTPAK